MNTEMMPNPIYSRGSEVPAMLDDSMMQPNPLYESEVTLIIIVISCFLLQIFLKTLKFEQKKPHMQPNPLYQTEVRHDVLQ